MDSNHEIARVLQDSLIHAGITESVGTVFTEQGIAWFEIVTPSGTKQVIVRDAVAVPNTPTEQVAYGADYIKRTYGD